MSVRRRTPNRQPGRHLPFPAELQRGNTKRSSDKGEHPLHGHKSKICSSLSDADGDFREYYRLR